MDITLMLIGLIIVIVGLIAYFALQPVSKPLTEKEWRERYVRYKNARNDAMRSVRVVDNSIPANRSPKSRKSAHRADDYDYYPGTPVWPSFTNPEPFTSNDTSASGNGSSQGGDSGSSGDGGGGGGD